MESLQQNGSEKKYRYFAFILLAFIYLLVYFHRVSPAIMVPELKKEFPMSAATLGLFASLYFYMYAIFQMPVGYLADSWGVRKTVSLFTLIAGLGSLLFVLSHSFGFVLFSRVIIGIGVAGVYIPTLRFLTNWFNTSEFSIMTGLLVSIGNAGAIIAATPLAFSISAFGWRTTLLFISIISILLAIAVFIFICDYPSSEREKIKKDRYRIKISDIKKVIFNKQMAMLCLAMFVKYGPIMGLQGLWGPKFFTDIFHYNRFTAGNILMAISFGYITGSLLVPVLSEKIFNSKKKVLIGGVILYIITWIPFVLIPSMKPLHWTVNNFLIGTVGGGVGVLIYSLTKESFPKKIAGVSISIVNNFVFIGAGVYQVIMGFILENFQQGDGTYTVLGYRLAFLACLLGTILMLVAVYYIKEVNIDDQYMKKEVTGEI